MSAEHAGHASVSMERLTRVLIAALALIVVWACLPFLPGLLSACVLTVLAMPTHRHLAQRVGSRTSALLLTLLALFLLVAPAILLIVAAIEQAPGALQRILASSTYARLAVLHVGSVDIGAQVAGTGRAALAWGSGRAVAAAGDVANAILNLLIGLVGFYYLLPAGPALWRRVRRMMPGTTGKTDHVSERFASITRAALLSIAATALSQGVTVGVAFVLVGLPNPLFWAVITGMVSILPILGSALVWLPASIVLFLDGQTAAGFALALIGVVICSNVDNIIRPFIFRRVSGVHPMVSLLGAFAGVKAIGIIGILVGPLALTFFLELLALHERDFAPPDAGLGNG